MGLFNRILGGLTEPQDISHQEWIKKGRPSTYKGYSDIETGEWRFNKDKALAARRQEAFTADRKAKRLAAEAARGALDWNNPQHRLDEYQGSNADTPEEMVKDMAFTFKGVPKEKIWSQILADRRNPMFKDILDYSQAVVPGKLDKAWRDARKALFS